MSSLETELERAAGPRVQQDHAVGVDDRHATASAGILADQRQPDRPVRRKKDRRSHETVPPIIFGDSCKIRYRLQRGSCLVDSSPFRSTASGVGDAS